MKKILLKLLVCLLIGTTASAEKVLTLWHGWTGTRTALVREVLDRFEAAHPGVKVVDSVYDPNQLGERLIAAVVAGVAPDVCMVGNDPYLGEKGALLALNELSVTNYGAELADLIYPSVLDQVTYDGQVYYLPKLMGTHHLIYYNRDLFAEAGLDPDQPPTTHSELFTVAQRLTQKSPDGNLMMLGVNVTGHGAMNRAYNLLTYLEQWGSTLISLDDEPLPDFQRAVDVLTWMLDFDQRLAGNAAESANFINRNGGYLQAMINDRLAMFTGADYAYYEIMSNSPTYPIGMALRPRPDGEPIRTSVDPAWGYGIPAGTKDVELAWELLKWVAVAPEGGAWFIQQQGRVSTSPAANADPINFELHPYWPVIISAVEHSVVLSRRGVFDMNVVGSAVERAMKGEEAPGNALLKLREELQFLLEEGR